MEKPATESLYSFIGKIDAIEKIAKDIIIEAKLKPFFYIFHTRTIELGQIYEKARLWALHNIPEIAYQMPAIDVTSISPNKGEIIANLEKIIVGCETAKRGLETILKPEVPSKVLSNINLLREELEKLLEKGLKENIARNLEEAISELESGHYLASALIASRVIVHLIDKTTKEVKRVLKLDKERIEDEDRVKYLIKIGAIPKEREDEQRRLILAMHRSRNLLSHRIYLFPKPEEALTLLSGAFEFARIMLKVPIKD